MNVYKPILTTIVSVMLATSPQSSISADSPIFTYQGHFPSYSTQIRYGNKRRFATLAEKYYFDTDHDFAVDLMVVLQVCDGKLQEEPIFVMNTLDKTVRQRDKSGKLGDPTPYSSSDDLPAINLPDCPRSA